MALAAWLAGLLLAACLAAFLVAVFASGHMSQQQAIHPDRQMVSAYKSQPWWALCCSFFAAAFGASALSANPEAGATGSWTSVVCYGFANALPYWILVFLGPKLQEFLRMEGFTIADFVLKRYGRALHVLATLLSLFFLFVWLSAELTSAGEAFAIIAPTFPPWIATVAMTATTAIYALFGGFKASILTDKIQAPAAIILVVIIVIGIFSNVDISRQGWKEASNFQSADVVGGLVLIISTTVNQFLDLGSWQRVFASESLRDAKLGLFSAGCVNFLVQTTVAFLGIAGAAAAVTGSIELNEGEEFLAFFSLLTATPKVFAGFTLMLVVGLATSTIDSLQNALAAAFASDLLKRDMSLHWSRLFAICVCVPALVLATTHRSVLSLFLLSNIFSTCVIPPIFLGLSPRLATSRGALAGTLLSALVIFIIGWSFERSFVDGLRWPLFPRGFSDWTTLLTFIVVPCVSAITTVVVSAIDLKSRPTLLKLQENLLERLNSNEEQVSRSPTCEAELTPYTPGQV